MNRPIEKGRLIALAAESCHLLVVVAVAVLAAWGLRGSGLVASADGELHLYRVFALDRALQQGLFFPRVLPDLLFGYGYPLFNFYPPASTYFVELLHLLGFGLLAALHLAYGICFVLAGLAMYAFARSAFRAPDGILARLRAAALLAALAYVLAPYFLINVYTRGALAEALAMALFPILLLATQHAVAARGYGASFALAFLIALLVLTHSALALFFLPILAGYGVVIAGGLRRGRTRSGARLLGAFGLGLAMSAFFWLPATLDRGFVSASNLETGFYDVRQNFLAWSDLIARTPVYPPTSPLPIPPRLGWAQVVIALAALPLLARRSAPRRVCLYWSAVGTAALFLITPASGPVWARLPLVAGLSFPWRLLAFASLATALLSGSLVLHMRPRLALLLSLALVATCAVTALPGIVPDRNETDEAAIDLARYWRFEFETSLVGTTSAAEYLPLALRAGSYALPRVPAEAYAGQDGGPPLDAAVDLLEAGAERLRLRVATGTGAAILAHAVHFPGWRATVDGVVAGTYPSTPLGLVTVDVPPGEHELVLSYDKSDAARVGDLVSLTALAAASGALLLGRWPRRLVVGAAAPGAKRQIPTAAMLVVGLPALAAGGLLLLGALVTTSNVPLVPPSAATGALSEDVDLLGWTPPVERAGLLRFNLYWLARRTPSRNEVVAITLHDRQGMERVRWERHPRSGFTPTMRWVAGEVIPDEYALPLPSNLAAGEYAIAVGFRDSPRRVVIGRDELVAGLPPPPPALPAPEQPLALRVGEGMRLFGFDRAPVSVVAPGQTLGITLYWQSLAVVERDYTIFLHLVDEKGERRAGQDAQPQDGRRPTILWQPGDVVVDRHELAIPADLPPGHYDLRLGAYAAPALARLDLFDGAGRRLGDSAAIDAVEVR